MFQLDGRWLSHGEWLEFLRQLAKENEAESRKETPNVQKPVSQKPEPADCRI